MPNETLPHNGFTPLPSKEEVSSRRHTDVSQDPRYTHWGLSAAEGDAACNEAPRRLPHWSLPHEETQLLFEAGHGTTPDLIYARGVPDTPSPDPTSFDKKQCTLIIVEIGFCIDLGCEDKFEEKNTKYSPLIAALRSFGGGWSSSHSLSATRVPHSPEPRISLPPPSPPSDQPR
jgi:hypothetical protein